MTTRIALILFVMAAIWPSAHARCVQQATSLRLEVLKTESCLWAKSAKKPIVTELRETLTNVGDGDIILELRRPPTLRFSVSIEGGGSGNLAIVPPPPVLHSSDDPWFAPPESIRLAPGQSTVLAVHITELMRVLPEKKVSYRLGVTHNYPWRRPNEPEGQAFRLRQEEGNAKQSFRETVWFEGVRLQ
ncbi:hypothetical protein [Ahniella affigens]|nr:hypothetical protein [Ahniella affigens]